MNTLTVGEIITTIDRMLRTENLPLTVQDKIEVVQEVVADLTATEDVLFQSFYIATTAGVRQYTLPANVKYVLGVWLRQSDGSYRELTPTPVHTTENALAGLSDETYAVIGNELFLQLSPPVSHAAGLLVRAITTHPNISSLSSITSDTLLPRYYRRLAAVMAVRRILESFLGDEAMNWIQLLAQEEEMLRQRLPKATGKYGGIGMERFSYGGRVIKSALRGG